MLLPTRSVPRGARLREVPENDREAAGQVPGLRQDGDAEDFRGSGLVFKGSGFYITDYGKDGKGPRKAESRQTGRGNQAEPRQATSPNQARRQGRDEGGKPAGKLAEKAASE